MAEPSSQIGGAPRAAAPGAPAQDPDGFADTISGREAKVEALNRLRMRQALGVMGVAGREFLGLLPVLLHCNHPRLPGFREGPLPYTIDGFAPDERQAQYLRSLGIDPGAPAERPPHTIMALYAMGSSSSVGQGADSDLDVWVCVDHLTPKEWLDALSEKCRLISSLARVRRLEVNLFVIPDNRFVTNSPDRLDNDNCGSAQNLILLDEFYRTAFRICGRSVIWYVVSSDEERYAYNVVVGKIRGLGEGWRDRWVDFGPVVNASPAEYFGSALWLLYKSISAPFKAMLKMLLMESYGRSYPDTRLLSSELKDLLLSAADPGEDPLRFDAYLMMFRRVSDYLGGLHDEGRLQLARMSFYLKIRLGLLGISGGRERSKRLSLLDRLATEWGWDEGLRARLGLCTRVRADFIGRVSAEMHAAFVASYRQLLRFSVFHGIEYAITSDDVGVLARRLSTAYDLQEGKIEIYPPLLPHSLAQDHLTFIRAREGSLCERGWHLYAAAPDNCAILEMDTLRHSESIAELVCWATFNGLFTPQTDCHVAGSAFTVTTAKLRRLNRELLALRPRLMPGNVDGASLGQRPRLSMGCIIVNLERDDTKSGLIDHQDLVSGNAFSLGKRHWCLVDSVDLLTRSSWGELRLHRFPPGPNGIAELLATLCRMDWGAGRRRGERANLQVISCADEHSNLIANDFMSLLERIDDCLERPERTVSFLLGRERYEARDSNGRGVVISRQDTLGLSEFRIDIISQYGMRPEFALQVPALVDRYATTGIMQYFFVPRGGSWNILILNEGNELRVYRSFKGSRARLVNSINKFYTKRNEADARGMVHFNLPQYFVLSPDLRSIHPFTIHGTPAGN
ncbi:MAG: class I adenylate cyclase [Succinivibrionaceae bacterium]|nr:class I adenylate cyclase [Succinivibrionaceae bacterium]